MNTGYLLFICLCFINFFPQCLISFHCIDISLPHLNLFQNILLFFMLLCMGLVFFPSDILLLVKRNATDFCILEILL